MLKRILSVIITASVMVASFAVFPSFALTDRENKLYNYIKSEYIRFSTEKGSFIDCSAYRSDFTPSEILEVAKTVSNDNPELFYITASAVHSNTYKIDVQYSRYFNSSYEKSIAAFNEFNAACSNIISNIPTNLNSFQKTAYLHDYLALNCTAVSDVDGISSIAYNAIVKGSANSFGYARAYTYLLRLAGIESVTISDNVKKNCWSLVKLDGSWYHVSVYLDDPKPDYFNMVNHQFFMLNDSEMSQYYSFTNTDRISDSLKYNNSVFQGSNSKFEYYKNKCLMIDSKGNIVLYNPESNTVSRALKNVDSAWYSQSSSGSDPQYYIGNYSSIVLNDNMIFYSSSDAVYMLDVNDFEKLTGDNDEITQVLIAKFNASDAGCMYGMEFENGLFNCYFKENPTSASGIYIKAPHRFEANLVFGYKGQSPDRIEVYASYNDGSLLLPIDNYTLMDYNFRPITVDKSVMGKFNALLEHDQFVEQVSYSVINPGDANCDGKVTPIDYIALTNHILDSGDLQECGQFNVDFDGDGTVTSYDCLMLKQMICKIALS